MNPFLDTRVARIAGVCFALGSFIGMADAALAPSLVTWKQSIATMPAPGEGCYTADFPSIRWRRIACTVAPLRPYVPASGTPANGRSSRTVGDGNDYAAVSTDIKFTESR